MRYGRCYDEGTNWTQKHLAWIRRQSFDHEAQNRVLADYLKAVEDAGERVSRLTADIEELIKMVYNIGMEDDCFFWFGNPAHVAKFRELDKKLALKVNVRTAADVQRVHERYAANIVEVGLDNMSEELIEACRERGIKVMVYHQKNDPEAFRRVIDWGADMINLNHGDVFKQVERDHQAAR